MPCLLPRFVIRVSIRGQLDTAQPVFMHIHCRDRRRHAVLIASASQNMRSFDSGDEEAVSTGSRMADEFAQVADPKRAERMKNHLALIWKVQKVSGIRRIEAIPLLHAVLLAALCTRLTASRFFTMTTSAR
jgi:altronate dehydratase